jgi:hypothetical protein
VKMVWCLVYVSFINLFSIHKTVRLGYKGVLPHFMLSAIVATVSVILSYFLHIGKWL